MAESKSKGTLGDFISQGTQTQTQTQTTEEGAEVTSAPAPAPTPGETTAVTMPTSTSASAPASAKKMTPMQLASAAVEYDEDGVVFVIGKREIKVPPIYFYSAKRCWQDMSGASSINPITRVEGILKVMVSCLENTEDELQLQATIDGHLSFEGLSRKLRTSEWMGLTASYGRLLVLSGFLSEEELTENLRPREEDPIPGEAQGEAPPGNGVPEGASGSSKPSSNGKASPESSTLTEGNMVRGPTSIQ